MEKWTCRFSWRIRDGLFVAEASFEVGSVRGGELAAWPAGRLVLGIEACFLGAWSPKGWLWVLPLEKPFSSTDESMSSSTVAWYTLLRGRFVEAQASPWLGASFDAAVSSWLADVDFILQDEHLHSPAGKELHTSVVYRVAVEIHHESTLL